MPTSRLPATVLRSSGEWPCTSALGLRTRKYSAASSKLSPPSKATVSRLRSLLSRNSVGQGSAFIATSAHPFCRDLGAGIWAPADSFGPKHYIEQTLDAAAIFSQNRNV